MALHKTEMGRYCGGDLSRETTARKKSSYLTTMMLRRSRMIGVVMAAVTLAMLGSPTVSGTEVKGLGFYPPFEKFNARGDRTVSSWTIGGSAAVKQSFVRLTPDFPDNMGSMYSRLTGHFSKELPKGQFSIAMSFRVSGNEEKYHGNHLALVLGNLDQLRQRGETYGFPENFVGVGIVITPRAPADMKQVARDRHLGPRQFVSFIANNGTRNHHEVRTEAMSCASTMRYYQGRDDFNFLKSSRVRFGFYNGEVSLEVDSRNIGVWRKCVSVRLDDMPDGWLERAGVAITAQTGEEVSNNHDVMSVEVFTEKSEAFDTRVVDGDTEDGDPEGEDGSAEDAEAEARKRRVLAMRAHLEHEIDSVERILKASVEKLASVNGDISKRITKVEKTISAEVVSVLNGRVRSIEERVKANAAPALESRLKEAQENFHEEMGRSMEKMASRGSGWRLPFLLFLAFVIGVFVFSVKQYRRFMRSNYVGSYPYSYR